MQAPPISPARPETASLQATGARKALSGFLLSGLLFAFPGGILPAWGHHVTSEYLTISLYFVALAAGSIVSAFLSPVLLRRRGTAFTLAAGCAVAAAAMLLLAASIPPAPAWQRMLGLAVIALGADTLHTAIFHSIAPVYRHDPAATANLTGMMFGTGCFALALLLAGTFSVYTASSMLLLLAVIPAFAAAGFGRTRFEETELPPHRPVREILREIRNPGAVLLSSLVFFQMGAEWSIAGWLPLFLIQRLGISPGAALLMLALYWFSLTLGRIAVQAILPRVSHARLLFSSVLAAMLGCGILIATNNRFGAATGIVMAGGAFAAIYPLIAERIGHRFPNYHPGFYNDSVSLALASGLLAPAALGLVAWQWGVRYTMLVPMFSSVVVFLLVGLIWVESRLASGAEQKVADGSSR